MSDNSQVTQFDPEEAGRLQAHALISIVAANNPTIEALTEALAQARRALLETLDSVDPAQVIEIARQNATPDAIRVRLINESEQRTKDRGSSQDPLYPPIRPGRWD